MLGISKKKVAKCSSARFEAYYVDEIIMYRHWTGQKIPGQKFVKIFEEKKTIPIDIGTAKIAIFRLTTLFLFL